MSRNLQCLPMLEVKTSEFRCRVLVNFPAIPNDFRSELRQKEENPKRSSTTWAWLPGGGERLSADHATRTIPVARHVRRLNSRCGWRDVGAEAVPEARATHEPRPFLHRLRCEPFSCPNGHTGCRNRRAFRTAYMLRVEAARMEDPSGAILPAEAVWPDLHTAGGHSLRCPPQSALRYPRFSELTRDAGAFAVPPSQVVRHNSIVHFEPQHRTSRKSGSCRVHVRSWPESGK